METRSQSPDAGPGPTAGTSLAVHAGPQIPSIERVKALLAECVRVDEVKEIRDQAVAVAAYYQQRADALDIQNNAAEIRLRAERRLGELLRETPRNKGGRGSPAEKAGVPPPLADIGITHKQSSMWQRIAAIAEESFEDRVAEAKENGLELTTSRVLGPAKPPQPAAPAENDADDTEAPPAPFSFSAEVAPHINALRRAVQRCPETDLPKVRKDVEAVLARLDDRAAHLAATPGAAA